MINDQIVMAVCCPGEQFSSRWLKNWTNLVFHLTVHRGFSVTPFFEFTSSVYATRNALAELCLSIPGLDYILWMDDDNILDIEQFEKLWYGLRRQPEAAGIAAWAWCENDQYPSGAMISCGWIRKDKAAVPFTTDEFVGTIEDIKAGKGHTELRPVGYTGFPALLMPARTLREIGPDPFVPYLEDVHPFGMSGEDYAFCRRCQERFGGQFFVDPLCQVPHLKVRAIQPTRLLQFEPKKECAA